MLQRKRSNRLRVEIDGAGQGVWLPAVVDRLAYELGLAGWAINDTEGASIQVEGGEVIRPSPSLDLPPGRDIRQPSSKA